VWQEMGRKTTYSVAEAQKILGISQKAVYKLIKEEKFTAVRISGTYYILKPSFDEWFEAQSRGEADRDGPTQTPHKIMEEEEENTLGKRCYTVKEVMELLGISRPSVYDLLKRKEFRYVNVANKYLISKKSGNAWLDQGISTLTENKVR